MTLRQPLPVAAASNANPIKNSIDVLRQILVWHLSEHIVPRLIADSYSSIELSKAKEMLGNAPNFDQIVSQKALLASGNADAKGFVEVRAAHASNETFALGADRVQNMVKVVQFLERQQYDVAEAAQQ